jgi:hypothetical protein
MCSIETSDRWWEEVAHRQEHSALSSQQSQHLNEKTLSVKEEKDKEKKKETKRQTLERGGSGRRKMTIRFVSGAVEKRRTLSESGLCVSPQSRFESVTQWRWYHINIETVRLLYI